MASDKEGDRSLSGRNSSGDREGTGGGPGGPAGTGQNSGTNSTSGSQGSGTSSSWGGSPTGGGNQGSGTPGSSPGGGWGSGSSGTGGTAMGGMVNTGGGGGTSKASGGGMGGMVNTGGGGAGGATGARSVTSATANAISRGVAQGLAAALGQHAPAISPLAARAATTVPSMGGMVATNIGTPTGFSTPTAYGAPAATPTGFASFRPDLGLRPDLNPAVAADARVQAALGKIRSFEFNTTPYDLSVYSKRFGNNKTVSGLTGMKLSDAIAYQNKMKGSKALGAYQITDIAYAAKKAGISLDAKFDISTQDRLARALADNRMRQSTRPDGTIDLDKFARQLSKEWASFHNPALGTSNYPDNNTARGTSADTQDLARNFAAAAGVPATTAATGVDTMTTNTVMPAVGRGVRGSRMTGVAYGPPAGAASFADKYLGTGRPGVTTPASGFTPDRAVRQAISGADVASLIGPTNNGPPSTRDIAERTALSVAQANAADLAASTGYRPGTVPPSQALAPGPVGAGFASAISPQAPAQTPYAGRPEVPGSLPAAQPPSQALAPGPIGAGFSSAVAPSIAALGSTPADVPVDVGPPLTSLTNRAIAGTLTGPTTSAPAASLTNQTIAQGLASAIPNPTMDVPPARPEQQYDSIAGRITLNGQPVSIERFKSQSPEFRQALSNFGKLQKGAINLNSLDRDPVHNRKVGGAKASEHLNFNAMDLDVSGQTDEERVQTVVNLRAAGFTRIGTYSGNTAIHADNKNVPPAKGYDVHPMYNTKIANMPAAHDWFKEGLAQPIDRAAVSLALGGPGTAGPAAGLGEPDVAGGFPPAPTGPADAVTPPAAGNTAVAPGTTAASTTPRPAGTGPATGPWGDDKLEGPIPGQNYPLDPMTDMQKAGAFVAKGVAGAVSPYINMLDLGVETLTGRGIIDRIFAGMDDVGTGRSGSYRSLTGETASASGRDRATSTVPPTTPPPAAPVTPPIATVNNVVAKYIEDKTWRPTPAQRWNYEDSKYSEYA